MVNRSKNIGTSAETHVVRYLQANGFPNADRRALKGSLDVGDILVCPGLIVEVKAGAAAENASDGQLRLWCLETVREKANAKADSAFLVVKRAGHGVAKIGGWHVVQDDAHMLTKFRLDEYLIFLQALGFGSGGFTQPVLRTGAGKPKGGN